MERKMLLCNTIDGKLYTEISKIMVKEAKGNHSYILSDTDKNYVTESMKSLEEKLEPYGFCRIHKSYMVNVGYIRKILTKSGNFVVLDSENIAGVYKKQDIKYPLAEKQKTRLFEILKGNSV